MTTQIVLDLPDTLFRSAERLATGTRQPVQGVLTEVLTGALTGWDVWSQPVSEMSDEQVLALTDSQMALEQSKRLSELLDRQQAGTLTPGERPELWTLTRIYQLGQLQKAEALAESVTRNLRLRSA